MSPHPVPITACGEPLAVPGLPSAAVRALLDDARTLPQLNRPWALAGVDGRHVALLAASNDDPSAQVFADAALALGAHVARLAPADLGLSDLASSLDTARLLGRLYVAVGCAGVDPRTLALLKRSCGVPVLHDLAASTHASRLLADVLTLHRVWREAPLPPAVRPRLGVCGPVRSHLLRAWTGMAECVGVEVIRVAPGGADARALGCHFICTPGTPPRLQALGDGTKQPLDISLAEQQRGNHRLVVQTMLQHQLGTGR